MCNGIRYNTMTILHSNTHAIHVFLSIAIHINYDEIRCTTHVFPKLAGIYVHYDTIRCITHVFSI